MEESGFPTPSAQELVLKRHVRTETKRPVTNNRGPKELFFSLNCPPY